MSLRAASTSTLGTVVLPHIDRSFAAYCSVLYCRSYDSDRSAVCGVDCPLGHLFRNAVYHIITAACLGLKQHLGDEIRIIPHLAITLSATWSNAFSAHPPRLQATAFE